MQSRSNTRAAEFIISITPRNCYIAAIVNPNFRRWQTQCFEHTYLDLRMWLYTINAVIILFKTYL
jgi:hypothetical protein